MAKVLVTGGAGYLGTEIVPGLLRAGHEVTVLDNLLYNQHTLLNLCSEPKFDFVHGDAREESLLKEHVAKADILIPLAAVVGAPSYLNGYAAIPLISGLLEIGMTPGAAMAFITAGAVSSIPAAIAVWALVKKPVFALYLLLGLSGATLAGFVYQLSGGAI